MEMNWSQTDYYKVLGLKENASSEAIKKAYKRLRVSSHPDKGGSDQYFQAVNKAYTILNDPETREIYDQGGHDAIQEYEKQRDAHQQQRVQLQPLIVEVECNLAELYSGTQKTVKFQRMVIEGDIKKPQSIKKSPNDDEFELLIPPSTIYGEKIVEHEKGHRHKVDDLFGDLVFVIVPPEINNLTAQHPLPLPIGLGGMPGGLHNLMNQQRKQRDDKYKGFSLEGLDLNYTIKLTLSEALIGFKIPIEFLDGRTIVVSSAKITPPGTVKEIKDFGFAREIPTHMGMMKRQGNLHLHFELDFPEQLSPQQLKHVALAFGVPRVFKDDIQSTSSTSSTSSTNNDLSELESKFVRIKLDDLLPPQPEEDQNEMNGHGHGPVFINGGQMGQEGCIIC
jgi:DnaJ family protein A protein 2